MCNSASPPASLSAGEARRVAAAAQLINTVTPQRRSAAEIISRLGCLQLDAISVLRRSHELSLLARGCDPQQVRELHQPPRSAGERICYEGWAHAHSLINIDLWPAFAWQRHQAKARGLGRWSSLEFKAVRETAKTVLAAISARGPLTLGELEKSRGSGWQRTSASKIACQWLLRTGELVCMGRTGSWQRLYALPEQAFPRQHYYDVGDGEGLRLLVGTALRALGVARISEIADYFRLSAQTTKAVLAEMSSEAQQITVEGLPGPWYAHPGALADPAVSRVEDNRITFVSLLDPLVWHRPRLQLLYGRSYLLEAYLPADRRSFGYYALPIAQGAEIRGRIALRKLEGQLRIEALEYEGELPAAPLQLLADWAEG